MIDLLDPSALPKESLSNGPETWGEAWRQAAATTDETMRVIENTNADYDALERAYDLRIAEIRELTGQELANPMRVASEVDREMINIFAAQAAGGGTVLPSQVSRDYRRRQEEEFNERARALADRFPGIEAILSKPIMEQRNQVMREAEANAALAAQSPELGLFGRISAQLAGGLKGAALDPAQWGMAMLGAGGSAAKTVAGRIGQTMLQEGLINGSQELLLQAMSQERKREAGLEHGLGDMLANAGIAATFGALFGGTVQGGAELARIFKLGEGGAEQAARVIEGRPEPGDVEAVAKAMNVELGPEKLDLLTRSFEERVLDDAMVPADGEAAQLRVFEAAKRYAEDPGSHPPPELIERLVADEATARDRFSPEIYERMRAGDQNVIDDVADALSAGTIDDAAMRIEAAAGRVDAASREVGNVAADLAPLIDPARLDAIARARMPVGPKPRQPQSLMDFIAAEGGIREDAGELQALGLSRKFVPGRGALVRKNGQSLDYAREAAAQAGYFNHLYGTADEATAQSTVADLLNLLDEESRGNKVYSMADQQRIAAMDAYKEQLAARDEYREVLGKFETAMREVAPDSGIDEAVLVRATDLMIEENLPPLAAFDRAILEDEARFAEHMDDIGQGYRDDPAYEEIPFFDEPAGTASGAGRAAGKADADGGAGGRGANAADRDQSPGAGEASPGSIDPLEGQTIRPREAPEPLDDAAERIADDQAGEIVEPARDANGNPENFLDFVGVEDGDGNVKIMSTAEALAMADEPAFFADLLEACKL